jgi:hypothetical protein
LDRWISAEVRTQIEARFYAQVNDKARFEALSRDPQFMQELGDHVGLFSDHGVVHMRDVALQTVAVLAQVHGLLIGERPLRRLEWMQGYGLLLACFHDVGMIDFSLWGRMMHPEFAAQLLFDVDYDDIFDALWAENSGNVAWRLVRLVEQGVLDQDPRLVLRELLALSFCHSKSKVPVRVLNDPAALRTLMIRVLSSDLNYLYHEQQVERLGAALAQRTRAGDTGAAIADLRRQLAESQQASAALQASTACVNPNVTRFYAHAAHESLPGAYRWLVAAHPTLQRLVADVQDTLRALRCADALRQRGTTLKTSGGYEIFVDQQTADAVYALRLGADRLYLLRLPTPISAGEANLASSELDTDGNVRVSFHRGAFATAAATARAARAAAAVLCDIKADIIDSFRYDAGAPVGRKAATAMQMLLETTPDNPSFARLVRDELLAQEPDLPVVVVPSLKLAAEGERRRYLSGEPVDWDEETRRQFLARMAQAGHRVALIDPTIAFAHTRLLHVAAGDVLIEAGAPSAFVYVPMGPGLTIFPLGGYRAFAVEPWMPLGATGVIRGAARNATISAARDLSLLAIPDNVYLEQWHQTYPPDAFRAVIARAVAATPGPEEDEPGA